MASRDRLTIESLLRKRYSPPEWAILFEVANGTGGRKSRSADALAMNLWPSRGLALHGFEIKSHRSDFLSELKKPEKSEAIQRYCNHWWLVTEEDVAELDEVPATWGWLTRGKGKLRVMKIAPELASPAAPTTSFLAAVMRSLANAQERWVPQAEIADRLDGRYEAGVVAGENRHGIMKRELESMKRNLEQFEEASGITIDTWHGGSALGEAVKLVLHVGPARIEQRLEGLAAQASLVARGIQDRLRTYRETKEERDERGESTT
jgi:hypothetical protein